MTTMGTHFRLILKLGYMSLVFICLDKIGPAWCKLDILERLILLLEFEISVNGENEVEFPSTDTKG